MTENTQTPGETKVINVPMQEWQVKILKEYFSNNDNSPTVQWSYDVFNKALESQSIDESVDEKIERLMAENEIDWQSLHLYIMNRGYVILTEEEYAENND